MKQKHGVSLIAVLLFMLAATVASIVVFRWIGQEGFTSGARLKSSESYQASQAGLEAVQGWLTNRGAEAGILIKTFETEYKTGAKQPVRLSYPGANDAHVNLLGEMRGNKGQDYQVYLTGADVGSQPYKLKFISEGTARDGSKYSQVGIFNVAGLYKVKVTPKRMTSESACSGNTCDFDKAFYGGIKGNTQANWSSAIVNGDLNTTSGEGIRTTGSTIITGSVLGNGFGSCGSNSGQETTSLQSKIDTNDVFIMGDLNTTRLNICGSIYVGGTVGGLKAGENCKISGDTWNIIKDFYTVGGFSRDCSGQPKMNVGGNLTSCGDINITKPVDNLKIEGNVVLRQKDSCALPPVTPRVPPTAHPVLRITPSANMNGPAWFGNKSTSKFWSAGGIRGSVNCGTNLILGRGGIYFPNVNTADLAIVDNCLKFANQESNEVGFNFNKNLTGIIRDEPILTGATNRPEMADTLPDLSGKVNKETGLVPDPLLLDEDMKKIWLVKAAALLHTANNSNVGGGSLPNACIYLLKTKGNPDGNSYCQSRQTGSACANTGGFAGNLNKCYEELYSNSSYHKYLYSEGNGDMYLPVALTLENAAGNGTPVAGNFVWIFDLVKNEIKDVNATDAKAMAELKKEDILSLSMNQVLEKLGNNADNVLKQAGTLKLPPTTVSAKVLVYLPKGAQKLEMSERDKIHNYFIFSEGNINEASGNGSINGSVFLAQKCGSSGNQQCTIGNLPDTKLDFNRELYESLLRAGILKQNPLYGAGSSPDDDENSEWTPDIEDQFYIPSAPHLKVTLQSKYKSAENPSKNPSVNVEPAVLVLPRVVYLPRGAVTESNRLEKYYSVLYLNGANKAQNQTETPITLPSGCKALSSDANGQKIKTDITSNNGAYFHKDGAYECEVTSQFCGGSFCRNHPFYIIVDGTGGNQRARLIADKTEVSAIECATVHVELSNANYKEDVPVSIVLLPTTNTDGWTITPNDGIYSERTVLVPKEGTKTLVYNICLAAAADRGKIEVRINSRVPASKEQKYDLGDPSSIIIEEKADKAIINRVESDDSKKCPSNIISTISNSEWIYVSCSGKETKSLNNQWECRANSAANWSIIEPSGCEWKPGGSSTGTVSTNATSSNTITASLKWKTAQVNVTGGSVTLQQNTYSDIETSVTCSQSSPCTIYQNVNYVASLASGNSSDAMMWSCTPSGSCSNAGTSNDILVKSYDLNEALGRILKAIGTDEMQVTIALTAPPAPALEGCYLNSATKTSGQTIVAGDIHAPVVSGYGCDDVEIRYCFDNSNCPYDNVISSPISGNKEIYAVANCGNQKLQTYCGEMKVTTSTACQYGGWCGAAYSEMEIVNSASKIITSSNGPKCYFATGIARLANQSEGSITVNGVTFRAADGNANGGRCGRTDWGQKTCAEALTAVPSIDGGYYIYAPNWHGDFQISGSGLRNCSENSGGGSTTCTGESDIGQLCPGISWGDVKWNVEPVTTSQRGCYYIYDFSFLNILTNSTYRVNGIERTGTNGSSGTKISDLNTSKIDGGFYIYIPNTIAWAGNEGIALGSKPYCTTVSGGSDNGCDYDPAWCDGVNFDNVVTSSQNGDQNGIHSAYSSTKRCVYATEILNMGNENGYADLSMPLTVNGVNINPPEGRCGSNHASKTCAVALSGRAKADGGYYIYIPKWAGQSFETTGGTPNCTGGGTGGCQYQPSWCGDLYATSNLVPTTKPTGHNSNARCVFLTSMTGAINIGSNDGDAKINNKDCSGWKANVENDCDGVKDGPKDGGYYVYTKAGISINTLPGTDGTAPNCTGGAGGSTCTSPTISCQFKNSYGDIMTDITYGEKIPSPTITCSCGTMNKSQAVFNYTTGCTGDCAPSNSNSWRTNGTAHYSTSLTGTKNIKISSGVSCSGTSITGETSCGSLNLITPNCSVSGTYNVGQTITPTVSCGKPSVLASNVTFTASNWVGNSNSGGHFTETGTYSMTINTMSCDGNALSSPQIKVPCSGTVTVVQPTIALDDGNYKGPLSGNVNLTCNTQRQVYCYADPSENISLQPPCNNIGSWAVSTNPAHIGSCGTGGQGGTLSCSFPTDKNIYCKRQQ